MSNLLSTLRKLPFYAAVLTSMAGNSTHAAETKVYPPTMTKVASEPQVLKMLQEIYALPHPVRFQKIDVSTRAMKSIPVGTTRSALVDAFKPIPSSRIVKGSPENLVVRDDKGRAMLDPDARSIVMTFAFDNEGKVRSIDAVYLKNQ